jgi:hypothetical protein
MSDSRYPTQNAVTVWDGVQTSHMAVVPLKDGRWAALAEPWNHPWAGAYDAPGSPWRVATGATLAVGLAWNAHSKFAARRAARAARIRAAAPLVRAEPMP